MATENVSEATQAPLLTDRYDRLTQKLAQLRAMLLMTYGNAGADFRNMADNHQDDYLWGCFDLAQEAADLADAIAPALYPGNANQEVTHG